MSKHWEIPDTTEWPTTILDCERAQNVKRWTLCDGYARRLLPGPVWKVVIAVICTAAVATATTSNGVGALGSSQFSISTASNALSPAELSEARICPQVDPIVPEEHAALAKELDEIVNGSDFRQWAYESLSRAVKIPCELTLERRDYFLIGINQDGVLR